MKNFLAIDTSSSSLTVAAANGGNVFVETVADCAMNHSVKLMETVEKALNTASLSLQGCDFFACSVGAGSFTGIRIGIATVKGLCAAVGKPALAVTSFESVAYNVDSDKVLAVLSAGHGHYYACGFDGQKRVIFPPSYLPAEKIEALAEEYALAGFEDLPLPNYTKTDVKAGFVRAVIEKATRENPVPAEKIEALYVRKSQAEENRK